jgi:hypothetical protein
MGTLKGAATFFNSWGTVCFTPRSIAPPQAKELQSFNAGSTGWPHFGHWRGKKRNPSRLNLENSRIRLMCRYYFVPLNAAVAAAQQQLRLPHGAGPARGPHQQMAQCLFTHTVQSMRM